MYFLAPERPGPPPSSGGQSQKNLKAKAMFPYIADQEDEITIKEGDIVDVISRETEQDGWWLVRLGNNEGLVPDNFLSLIQSGPPSTSNINGMHLTLHLIICSFILSLSSS